MAARQQTQHFTDAEADRFAALMAGFDTGNPSEAEAMNKGRAARRMAIEKGLRLCDAWELPEIRHAVDRQLQPVRAAIEVVKEVEYVNEGCSCAPWPVQMLWSFVGVVAWVIAALLWPFKIGFQVLLMELERKAKCRHGRNG